MKKYNIPKFLVGLVGIVLSVVAFLSICLGWIILCIHTLGEGWGAVVAILGAIIVCVALICHREVTEFGENIIDKFRRG